METSENKTQTHRYRLYISALTLMANKYKHKHFIYMKCTILLKVLGRFPLHAY